MSQLLNKLDRINRGSPAPMGFGAATRVEKTPAMVLIGDVSRNFNQGTNRVDQLPADGALMQGLPVDDNLSRVTELLTAVPWGIRVDQLDQAGAKELLDRGCDFIIVRPENSFVDAMKDDQVAYLMDLPSEPTERFLRAIEDLPVDAIVMDRSTLQCPVTLLDLISIASVRSMFEKYLIVHADVGITPKEIESLRDVGVDGLIVDAQSTKKDLKDLHQRLLDVPRQRRAKSDRFAAVLPRSVGEQDDDFDIDDED